VSAYDITLTRQENKKPDKKYSGRGYAINSRVTHRPRKDSLTIAEWPYDGYFYAGNAIFSDNA